MTSVANFDVATLAEYFAKFAKELSVSQAARQAEFPLPDRARARSYLGRVQDLADLVAGQRLDLPKLHPDSYPVIEFLPDEAINGIENSLVQAVLRRFKAGYTELVGSQSKDAAAGLHQADKQRLDQLIAATLELVNFGTEALDLPEFTGEPVAAKR
jgi:hypothetical protein